MFLILFFLLKNDLISRLDGDVSFDIDVDLDDVDVGEFVTNPIPVLVGIGGTRERFGKTKLAFDHLVSRLIESRKKIDDSSWRIEKGAIQIIGGGVAKVSPNITCRKGFGKNVTWQIFVFFKILFACFDMLSPLLLGSYAPKFFNTSYPSTFIGILLIMVYKS